MCHMEEDSALADESQAPEKGKRGKKGKGGSKIDSRLRVFAFIVYMDSAFSDWIERLRALHVRAFISPLHDRDVMADGTPKKPHWHVVLIFDGKKSIEQINAIREDAIGPNFNRAFEVVHSLGAYSRYLIHMDNPEKAQYDRNDVTCLGGADYDAVTAMPGDDVVTLARIAAYIGANGVNNLLTLIATCDREGRRDWLSFIARKGYLVNQLVNQEMDRQMRVYNGMGA